MIDQLAAAGVGRGAVLAVVVAPGAGVGLAAPDGPAWGIAPGDPASLAGTDDERAGAGKIT